MTDDEWNDWVDSYSTIFGLFSPDETKMLHSWRPVFATQDFTRDELAAATEYLATNPPKWRTEHLIAIQSHVRLNRESERVRSTTANPDPTDYGTCSLCHGSGLVIVPDLRTVQGGNWEPYPFSGWQETVAICTCLRGRNHLEKYAVNGGQKFPPRLRLDTYEKHNPGWQQQRQARQHLQIQQREARQTAGELDRLMGQVLQRVRERGES